MTIELIKAETVVSAGLGILERESVLGNLVWRNAVGSFAGAKDDTITIRVPIYTTARTRALRSGTTRERDDLQEHGVDVKLDTGIYKDVRITDEQLTLDISNFGVQVLNPMLSAVARKYEDLLAEELSGGTYANTIDYSYGGNAWTEIIVHARRLLNDANVPMDGRVLACGPGIEEELLGTDLFVKANESGGTSALTEATVGRKAGFTVVGVPALDPDEAYAFHKSAYILNNVAPVVPAGAPYGSSQSYNGYAIRVVQVLDSEEIVDILALDAWAGTATVTDSGTLDGTVFVPAESTEDSGVEDLVIRSVQITASS